MQASQILVGSVMLTSFTQTAQFRAEILSTDDAFDLTGAPLQETDASAAGNERTIKHIIAKADTTLLGRHNSQVRCKAPCQNDPCHVQREASRKRACANCA